MVAKKARIKDIAKLAGVSIGTVDRVLHERGEVAEETRKKVLQIANELEYSPNLMARALKSKQSCRLVALLPEASDENAFWYKHQQGLEKARNELLPFQVLLEYVTFDMQSEDDFRSKAEIILHQRPDGVLFAPIFKNESLHFCQDLGKSQIPYLFVDSYIEEHNSLAYVGEDAYQSGRVAAQLIDFGTSGNKDILIINVVKDLDNRLHLSNRTQGFLSYFMDTGKNSGLKISLELQKTGSEDVKVKLDEVFRNNPNIGAIFVTSSKTYKVARYLELAGIKGVNLVGYDIVEKNIRFLRTGYIKFLIGQRPAEQTEKGVRILFEYILSGKVPIKMEYFPIDVVNSENVNYFI